MRLRPVNRFGTLARTLAANSLPFRHHPPNPTQSHAQDGKGQKNFASLGFFRAKMRQIGEYI